MAFEKLFLPCTCNQSCGVLARNAGDTMSFSPHLHQLDFLASLFTLLPDDYLTNGQIKMSLVWGAKDNATAGISTTFLIAYGVHKEGQQLSTLIDCEGVVVASPYVASERTTTLLATITPTATAGDILVISLKMSPSDSENFRFLYGFLIEYEKI